MRKFKRGLRNEAMLCLQDLTDKPGDNWWKDLLHLWTPSGCGEGLRLAVRYNTLDFYYRGSVVAHISFSRGERGVAARARVQCHLQFIFEGKIPGQKRALFNPERGLWEHDKSTTIARRFDEIIDYIKRWQDKSAETGKKSGKADEKIGVDAIVGNSGNIIDLEMGLPAWEKNRYSMRMDFVSLERTGGAIEIVFSEAKTFDDTRLRSESRSPEVIRQLLGDDEDTGYVKYVEHGNHATDIRDAYAKTCAVLDRLHRMKCAVGSSKPTLLHPTVTEVARLSEVDIQQRLLVRSKPRLVIYSDTDKKIESDIFWPPHRTAILEAGITILEKQNSKDITLPVENLPG